MNTHDGVPDEWGRGVALADCWAQAYNEKAFRYFLGIERRRAERSGRPLLLLLVDVDEQSERSVPIDAVLAHRLLSGLRLCLRESDLVGWYCERRVAGAVLMESENWPTAEVAHRITQRVRAALCARVPSDVGRRLRVRLHHTPATENIELAAAPYTGAVRSRRV